MSFRLWIVVIRVETSSAEKNAAAVSFEDWLDLYQKKYATSAERNYREKVFLANVRHVQDLNAQYRHRSVSPPVRCLHVEGWGWGLVLRWGGGSGTDALCLATVVQYTMVIFLKVSINIPSKCCKPGQYLSKVAPHTVEN